MAGFVNYENVGGIAIPWKLGPRWRLKAIVRHVRDVLPREWLPAVQGAAQTAVQGVPVWEHDRIKGDAYRDWITGFEGADRADMSHAEIVARAEELAGRAKAARFVPGPDGWGAWGAWARLCEFAAKFGAVISIGAKCYKLNSWRLRLECSLWWRRQLRKMVAQSYERGAIKLGLVGAAAGQWYCSNRAVVRRVQQVRANDAAMREKMIEGADGAGMSIWQAAQLSVSNKAIRRGELMTRIKGCETWADSQGLAGLFTTNTCPSRFHSQRKGGGVNPKYDGSTPGDAQRWLCLQWARLRSKLAREKIPIVGFRVAEPHHDGCPHWHMLLWCQPEHAAIVETLMRQWWLKDDGKEPGAAEHRVKVKPMLPGAAAGYIAKYISKNIDDAHTPGHVDGDEMPGQTVGPDLLGDLEILPSQRVEAWASLWRIRQFQAIGQPPVTVWREFRRVDKATASGGSDAFIQAWIACHRERGRLANWQSYMNAQGGAMLPRDDYRFCRRTVDRERVGRYGVALERWACGVVDRQCQALGVLPSKRQRWGALGFAATRSGAPWTRFNNCTPGQLNRAAKSVQLTGNLCRDGRMDIEGGYFDPDPSEEFANYKQFEP